jgi:lysophospholipid hydrolase
LSDQNQEPDVDEYERFMLNMKTTARKEMVFLHAERHFKTGSTRQWLQKRPWIQAHHHVQLLNWM